MDYLQIIIRVLLSVIVGGIIGYEREARSRPAGMRTHIMVALGACIIALVQMEVAYWSIELAQTTSIEGAIRSDPVRLIAQVVSGIGFLGAGTIIFDRGRLTGLTTAASLWTVAALGIAAGMGFYEIVITGLVVMYLILRFLKVFIQVHSERKIEIRYRHRLETKEFITSYFDKKNIEVLNVDFNVVIKPEGNIYTNIYTIDAPKGITYPEIIEDISENKNVTKIRIVSI